MKAYAHSLRIAPKKANLIAKMVRGMLVHDAIDLLSRTNKKGARMVEILLKSAVANAQHNDKQTMSELIIKTIIVNQGTSMRRGIPMARGRMRPIQKFMSHISIGLGLKETEEREPTKPRQPKKPKSEQKVAQKASTSRKNEVESPARTKKSGNDDSSSVSSESSVSSVSSPK